MSDVVEKWGESVAQRGFAQIPNHLLLLNQFLAPDSKLTPIELLVLIQLAGGWWRKDELPFPSVSTLAARIGASPRQVQRALKRLEDDKFLERKTRRTRGVIASNAYDLAPLATILGEVAKAFPNAYPRKVRPAGPAGDAFTDVVMAADGEAVVEKVDRRGRRKSMF